MKCKISKRGVRTVDAELKLTAWGLRKTWTGLCRKSEPRSVFERTECAKGDFFWAFAGRTLLFSVFASLKMPPFQGAIIRPRATRLSLPLESLENARSCTLLNLVTPL